MITPYDNKTTDELLRLVFSAENPDPLLMELAQRLETAEREVAYWQGQVE